MAILKNTKNDSELSSITRKGDQCQKDCFNKDWCAGGRYTKEDPSKCLLYCPKKIRVREKCEVM